MEKLKQQLKSANKWFLATVALAALIVLYVGTGFAMKATDEAAFCGSCHVMNEAVRTYEQSVHASISCNDCHAPHDTIPKMAFKAKAGAKDIYKNTTGNVPDVIHATNETRDIVNDNCLNCHEMTNKNVAMDSKDYCVDCHRHVPHFNKNPIGERKVAGE
ncbi:cytochrome c nitrite reductase small subunit [Desulfitispora alkaliphila]|uniref:cytochrome c3 family protein n=1 Tax=Desulfitispora alkaliphila TaxID=622674 RepID=UPI003D254659